MKKIEISHRIEEYFNELGWTKAKFARAIGEYPQHLNKVFESKLDPLKYINNLNWLLTGEKNEDFVVDMPEEMFSIRPGTGSDTIEAYSGLNLGEQIELLRNEINRLKKELIGCQHQLKQHKEKTENVKKK